MITAQVERWSDCVSELAEIFPAHYEALALNKDKVRLAPRWNVYADLERKGTLFLMTLRSAGRMVGYFVGIIQMSLHYGDCLECTLDIFWTDPGIRNGHAGTKLFTSVRRELKRRGVQRWHVGSKAHADASAIFRRIGMTPSEIYYSEWIGG